MGYKWLLSQNQRLRNDFFGYRRYYTRAKHIKLFKKTWKCKGFSTRWLTVSVNSSYCNCKVVNHDKNAKQFLIFFHIISKLYPIFCSTIEYYFLKKYCLYPKLHCKMQKSLSILKWVSKAEDNNSNAAFIMIHVRWLIT